jgi:hypothetical protein
MEDTISRDQKKLNDYFSEVLDKQSVLLKQLLERQIEIQTRSGLSHMLVSALISVLTPEQKKQFDVVLADIAESLEESDEFKSQLSDVLGMVEYSIKLIHNEDDKNATV